ncbi:hypothetical protein ACTJJE_07230 [Mycolicibacterium sp. 22603]|uniref:hypothetical protein n=1 Tax=Mycolicibacterium sp. 22603 TaxID=3453950 RepID=UPI003F85BD5B
MTEPTNDPVPAPAAYLIGHDPTGATDVRVEHICDLTAEDYLRYKAADRTLYDVLVANIFTYVQGSVKVFQTIWQSANAALAANEIRPNTDPHGVAVWNTQLRASVLSLCMSIVHHQEQTYQTVCDRHGANGQAHQDAKDVFGNLYDNHRGYRYLYGLRNVMVHDSMDAVSIEASAARATTGQPIAVYDLYIDRSLMTASTKLNRNLRNEFVTLEEDPSVLELLAEVAQPLVDANRSLRDIVHPDLTEACRTIIEFDDLFEQRPGTRALVHEQSPELIAGFRFSYTSIAADVIGFARAYKPGRPRDDN